MNHPMALYRPLQSVDRRKRAVNKLVCSSSQLSLLFSRPRTKYSDSTTLTPCQHRTARSPELLRCRAKTNYPIAPYRPIQHVDPGKRAARVRFEFSCSQPPLPPSHPLAKCSNAIIPTSYQHQFVRSPKPTPITVKSKQIIL